MQASLIFTAVGFRLFHMLKLQIARKEDKSLLWNMVQKYLYEMSQFYDVPMDEEGNFQYRHFEEYFSDPVRTAYLIYNDDKLAGFALLNPYSCCGGNPDYTMAEFAILPAFRRKYLATDAVNAILDRHPGKWDIKYSERNTVAAKFWEKTTSMYSPKKMNLNTEERVLLFIKED